MEKLPENYQLHILGFGDEKILVDFLEEIGLSNKKQEFKEYFIIMALRLEKSILIFGG